MGGTCSMHEIRNLYKILLGKPEGKRPLRRHMSRWEDNIRMDLKEACLECVNWMHLAQDREQWQALVNTVNEPSGSIKIRGLLD